MVKHKYKPLSQPFGNLCRLYPIGAPLSDKVPCFKNNLISDTLQFSE